MTPPGENATALNDIDQDRWDATRAAAGAFAEALVSGELTEETLAGAIAEIRQIPLDMNAVLNAVHVPTDAGEHAAGLERILRRIPDGWGRWIGCCSGWYQLICELDLAIAELVPDYEVHQVKEKYGTLRYYIGGGGRPWVCCERFAAAHPKPDVDLRVILSAEPSPPRTDAEMADREVYLAWNDLRAKHHASAEHQENLAVSRALNDRVEALIDDAERAAEITCEVCAQPGTLSSRGGWLQTLCPICAQAAGALPLPDEDEDGVADPSTAGQPG